MVSKGTLHIQLQVIVFHISKPYKFSEPQIIQLHLITTPDKWKVDSSLNIPCPRRCHCQSISTCLEHILSDVVDHPIPVYFVWINLYKQWQTIFCVVFQGIWSSLLSNLQTVFEHGIVCALFMPDTACLLKLLQTALIGIYSVIWNVTSLHCGMDLSCQYYNTHNFMLWQHHLAFLS